MQHVPGWSSEERPSDAFGASAPGKLAAGVGIAVSDHEGFQHDVYVADATEHLVDVYAPLTLATAKLMPATEVTETSAMLGGEVNPQGEPVSGCEFEYEQGNEGTNTQPCSPAPGSGSAFEHVSASLTGLAEGKQYVVNLSVTDANGVSHAQQRQSFTTPYSFDLHSAGSGSGTLECELLEAGKEKSRGECETGYPPGTEMNVYATAAEDSTFEGWTVLEGPTKCEQEHLNPCYMVILQRRDVAANFALKAAAKLPLTVQKTGTGHGTINSNPPGLDCLPAETQCSHEFEQGATVTLTETPETGAEFSGWSGCTNNPTETECEVLISEAKTVDAEFTELASHVVPEPVTEPAAVEVQLSEGRGVLSATLKGKVRPNGLALSACAFEYGTSTAYGQSAQCVPAYGEIGKEGETPVTATVTGLSPDTTYHVRLIAANANDEASPAHGADVPFSTPGPGLGEAFVTGVSDVSASLNVSIDPDGAPTSWRFEYDTREYREGEAPHGTSIPVPEGSLGAGGVSLPLSQLLAGLTPSTRYFYRAVAVSQLRVEGVTQPVLFAGPQQSFTTQTASTTFALPDGRAWEMVSPPQKNGTLITTAKTYEQGAVIEAAPAGGALTYVASSPSESAPAGFVEETQLLSRRAPQGWSTRDLSIPHEQATMIPFTEGPEYRRFSSDLSKLLVQPFGLFTPCLTAQGAPQPCISPAASEQTPFLQDLQSGSYTPLVTGCPAPASGQPCPAAVAEHADVPPGTVFGQQQETEPSGCEAKDHFCGPWFLAATPDLAHVVLRSAAGLTEGEGAAGGLYEWSAGGLTFIGKGEHEGDGHESEPGATPARGAHGISSDGSRVIFNGTSESPAHQTVEGLLLRDTERGETLLLGEHGVFQTASATLSRVFFTEAGDLKLCEIVTNETGHLECGLTDLTSGAGALGAVLGASEDGSYVYFVSAGLLGDGAQHGALAGADNLYADHYEAGTWTPSFIATLTPGDEHDWLEQSQREGRVLLEHQPTRVSPDGHWLAFMSLAPLTGYDNREAPGAKPVTEVYLYHAAEGGQPPSLTCASCLPSGERPTGIEQQKLEDSGEGGYFGAWPDDLVAGELPGWENVKTYIVQPYQARYLTDQGRLFFNATDALVPLDTDGVADVYEYEPEGAGSCTGASSSGAVAFEPERAFAGGPGRTQPGCVGLISSGDSAEGSSFLEASEDGSEVFFLTNARLSAQDVDTAPDVYVARECTGSSPCLSSPLSPPACDNEASCRPAPSPQPQLYGPGPSETFTGPGDLPPAPPPAKPASKPKPLTRAQKLSKALKACRRKHDRRRRASCERAARKKYAAKAGKTRHTAAHHGAHR
ncbi:MAG TPA: hypothetical protein VLZ06_04785 [Solirubrobacteraceae bacterium]|nr:hypothetical protein [Solirubrobacteraceae bacterium]